MSESDKTTNERQGRYFASAVEDAFYFMEEAGFKKTESKASFVKYEKGHIVASLYYGRQSYEIGFEITDGVGGFSVADLIGLADPDKAAGYRKPAVTTQSSLLTAVYEVADLVRRYGRPALDGDEGYFNKLRVQRQSVIDSYALDVQASQIRPKAEAAFRNGCYQAAADLYNKMDTRLSMVERRKLEVARRKARSSEDQNNGSNLKNSSREE